MAEVNVLVEVGIRKMGLMNSDQVRLRLDWTGPAWAGHFDLTYSEPVWLEDISDR